MVYDLLFVYCLMYNKNSMNIRNDCVHGRGFNTGEELEFAFKAVLLCIYMIEYRMNLVLDKIKPKNGIVAEVT